jgi:F-type H+-transporting ATPase subunit epsilon
MKLTITTPFSVVVDIDDVAYLRAEDETGAFGMLPGHADFLTALSVSVATWRDGKGALHHVALRGGVLEVKDGNSIAIATREAVPGDDLEKLEGEVLSRFRVRQEQEKAARLDAQRLYLAAIRQITRFARRERRSPAGGSLPPVTSREFEQ